MKFKVRIPLQYVKPVCIAAVLVGIFAVAAGSWITGLCLRCWALTCWRKAATAAPTAAKSWI